MSSVCLCLGLGACEQVSQRPEEGSRSSGNGDKGHHKLPEVGAGN